jgi:hypothetical protein
VRRAVLGQGLDGVVDFGGVRAKDHGAAAGGHHVGGGLASHPAAAPDDGQLLPRKTGMAIGRLSCSIPSSMRSSQFMVIAAFLSPGGLSAPSLGAATRLHIARSAIRLRAVAFEEVEPGFADGREAGDGVPEPADRDLAGDGDGGRVDQFFHAGPDEGGAEQEAVIRARDGGLI